jgi:hypothetical protein
MEYCSFITLLYFRKMLLFNPKPNFTKLSKYYQFQVSPEILQEQYADGFPILIDWYYTNEMVDGITEQFTEIVNRFGLSDHTDNLMYLVLTKAQEFEALVTAAIDENNMMLKAKELAGFLLAYQNKEANSAPALLLKGFTDTYKISDPYLSAWIGSLVSKAITNGDVPLQLMNMATDYLFIETVDGERRISKNKVEDVYNRKWQNTSTYINQYQTRLRAEFCFYLLPYLNNETSLTKGDNNNFSDQQLSFLYEIMILLEFIKPGAFDKSMDYEPKDSIRNSLIKYAKAFGIKGNPNNVK